MPPCLNSRGWVEFLNEQMRADVRAVELRWFEGDSGD